MVAELDHQQIFTDESPVTLTFDLMTLKSIAVLFSPEGV